MIGEKTILHSLSLKIEKGEVVVILGPNGAGKSTLLKVLAMIMKQTSGQLLINGLRTQDCESDIKSSIGFLSHDLLLYDHFSPVENLLFYGNLYGVNNLKERVNQVIYDLDLQFFKNDPIHTFSQGMKQRLAIARAILHKPSILLLDEPHSGLDEKSTEILNQELAKLKEKGTTIVMATHDLHQAAYLCDRVVFMLKGKLMSVLETDGKGYDWLKEQYIQQIWQLK